MGSGPTQPLAEPWLAVALEAMNDRRSSEHEEKTKGKVFVLNFVPVPGESYLSISTAATSP